MAFFDENRRDIYRWVAGSGVLAVVVFDFAIRLRPNREWGLDGMSNWLETAHADDQADQEYTVFRNAFLKGVPNLKYLTREES